MMATAAFAIVMIGSFATMVMAQDAPGPDGPPQGPQAGQPAGGQQQPVQAVADQPQLPVIPAVDAPTQQEIDRILADQVAALEATRASLQGEVQTRRTQIDFQRQAMEASVRMRTVFDSLNTQYFGVLMDRSEAQFTLNANTQLPVPTITHGTIATRYNAINQSYEPMAFTTYTDFENWLYQNSEIVQFKDHNGAVITDMLSISQKIRRGEPISMTLVPQTYRTTVYRYNTTTGQYEQLIFVSNRDFQNWVQANINSIGAYDANGFQALFPSADSILSRVVGGEQMTLVFGEPEGMLFPNILRPEMGERDLNLTFEFGVKARRDRAALAQEDLNIAQRKMQLQTTLSSVAHQFVRMSEGHMYETVTHINLQNDRRIINRFQETVDLQQQIPADQFIYRRWPQGGNTRRVVAGEQITNMYELAQMQENNIPFQIWVRDTVLNEEVFLGSGQYAITSKLNNARAYQAERMTEFSVREILSRGVPNNMSLSQLQTAVTSGNLDGLVAQYRSGHRYFAFAELSMTNGRPSGLANLHEEGALTHATEQLAALDRRGTPMYRPQVNQYGFPTVRMPILNDQGQVQMTTIVQNGERVQVPQQQMVGFFIRNGSRWQRLKSNEVDGNEGRWVMRVINSETQANGSDTFYNEADLGNQLIFGRNVLRTKLVENRVGAFRNLVEVMDAEKNLNNLYGELVVATVGTIFNATLFFDPSGSGALINRAIPTGVRAAYQIFVQSQNLPTALPVINVDKRSDETLAQADARIRQEARNVLDNLNKTRGGGLITGLPDRILSTINLSMKPSDAQQLHEFIYAMAATVYSKEFNGYDSDNNPITTVTPEELDMVVVTLFHTDWHRHREITSRIDFFTSLMVNMVLLSNTGDESNFRLVRLEPDGSGGFNGVHARDTTHFSQLLQKFFVGDLGGSSVMPSPTTAGYLNLTSFARVFREVSSTKGVFESWPLPLGAGPSMASIIKTVSAGYFYEDSTYIWEPESLVFTLFGFPLQIFGSIRDNQNYIEGLRNYGVLARTESSQGWFERLGRTFIGGRALPITSLAQHQELDRQKVLLGYAQVPLPNQSNASQVTSTRVPVYGIMGDEGIEFIWVPGQKALDENLHQIQRDIANYDQYHQIMGSQGGAILTVSPGRYYNFTPANGRVTPADLGAFLRATRNGANQLTPSFWFNPQHAGPNTQPWQHWTATYDQGIRATYFQALNDPTMGNQIIDSLYGLRGGLKRNEQMNDQTSIPLYPNAINISNGRIAEGSIHAGPNAFVGLSYMHSMFSRNSHNRYLLQSYQINYQSGSNADSLRGYIYSGDIENYFDYLGPDRFNDLEDIEDAQGNELWDAPHGNLDDNIQNQNAQNSLAEMRLIAAGLMARMETEDETWQGVIWQDKANGVSSTEEMMAAYRYFANMHAITEESQYYDASMSVLRFLSKHMWNSSGSYFYAGTHKESGSIVANETYVTDVQAISLLSLGPEVLERMRDPDSDTDPKALFFGEEGVYVGARILRRLTDANTGSYVTVQHNGQTITGFDTTNGAGRVAIGRIEGTNQERTRAVFVEQTSYVSLAMQTYADYLERVLGANHEENPLNATQRARHRANATDWRNTATRIINSMKHLGVRSSSGGVGMPVATANNIRLYPFRDYRAPRNVAAAVAPTALFGLSLRSYNPYQLGGRFWYGDIETSGNASTLYSGLPQATQTPQNWSTQTPDIQVGTAEARTVTPGQPLFFVNETGNRPTEDLVFLLESLVKVEHWNRMSPADQARPDRQDLRPTAAELSAVEGKNFISYDQARNIFSYEEGGHIYTWTLISSYDQIQQSVSQYQVQLQRSQLESQIAQRGAIRFIDAQTGQALDIRGNVIGEGSSAVPHLRWGRTMIPDPNNANRQIVDTSSPNDMLAFLASQFARVETNGQPVFSAHEQHRILARGWFETNVDYVQEDGVTVRTVRTRIIIEHGLSGAFENRDLERADSQVLQRIRDMQRMHSISGVIETNAAGVLQNLYVGIENQGQANERNVGQTKVEEVLAWLRVHPERMAAAYQARFANIEYERPDGQTVFVTLVFGEGMAQNHLDDLQRQLTELQGYQRDLAIIEANLHRGPPYVHPERMNRYSNPRVDSTTGDVTVDVHNFFDLTHRIEETLRNNVVIRRVDSNRHVEVVNHPLLGDKYIFYERSLNGEGRTVTVATGLDRNGELVYTQVNNVLVSTLRVSATESIRFDWTEGIAYRETFDTEGNLLVRLQAPLDVSQVGSDQAIRYVNNEIKVGNSTLTLHFTEREERQYGTTSLEITHNGRTETVELRVQTGSVLYNNIDPDTGERHAGTIEAYRTRVLTDATELRNWGIAGRDWELGRRQGWTAIEMTNMVTGVTKVRIQNSFNQIVEERTEHFRHIWVVDNEVNAPVLVVDRRGRSGKAISLQNRRYEVAIVDASGTVVRRVPVSIFNAQDTSLNNVVFQYNQVQSLANGETQRRGNYYYGSGTSDFLEATETTNRQGLVTHMRLGSLDMSMVSTDDFQISVAGNQVERLPNGTERVTKIYDYEFEFIVGDYAGNNVVETINTSTSSQDDILAAFQRLSSRGERITYVRKTRINLRHGGTRRTEVRDLTGAPIYDVVDNEMTYLDPRERSYRRSLFTVDTTGRSGQSLEVDFPVRQPDGTWRVERRTVNNVIRSTVQAPVRDASGNLQWEELHVLTALENPRQVRHRVVYDALGRRQDDWWQPDPSQPERWRTHISEYVEGIDDTDTIKEAQLRLSVGGTERTILSYSLLETVSTRIRDQLIAKGAITQQEVDNGLLIAYRVTSIWGDTFTEYYKKGDRFGRPLAVQRNGLGTIINRWLEGTNIPVYSELLDSNGTTILRQSVRTRTTTAGRSYLETDNQGNIIVDVVNLRSGGRWTRGYRPYDPLGRIQTEFRRYGKNMLTVYDWTSPAENVFGVPREAVLYDRGENEQFDETDRVISRYTYKDQTQDSNGNRIFIYTVSDSEDPSLIEAGFYADGRKAFQIYRSEDLKGPNVKLYFNEYEEPHFSTYVTENGEIPYQRFIIYRQQHVDSNNQPIEGKVTTYVTARPLLRDPLSRVVDGVDRTVNGSRWIRYDDGIRAIVHHNRWNEEIKDREIGFWPKQIEHIQNNSIIGHLLIRHMRGKTYDDPYEGMNSQPQAPLPTWVEQYDYSSPNLYLKLWLIPIVSLLLPILLLMADFIGIVARYRLLSRGRKVAEKTVVTTLEVSEAISEEVLRDYVRQRIGGLNYRAPFIDYLVREIQKLPDDNSRDRFIENHYQFWRRVLRDQLQQKLAGSMRLPDKPLRRDYVFNNDEMDRLFMYTTEAGVDPVQQLFPQLWEQSGGDVLVASDLLAEQLTSLPDAIMGASEPLKEQVQKFVDERFRPYLDKERKDRGVPLMPFEISSIRLFWTIGKGAFFSTLYFILNVFSLGMLKEPLLRIFPSSIQSFYGDSEIAYLEQDPVIQKQIRKGKRVWLLIFSLWASYNLVLGGAIFYYFPTVLGPMAYLGLIPFGLHSFLAFFSFAQYIYGIRATQIERQKQLATVQTWKDFVRVLPQLLQDPALRVQYRSIIEDQYQKTYLNAQERDMLLQILSEESIALTRPENAEFSQYIQSWANKQFMLNIPALPVSWDQVKGVSVQISSFNEKFQVSWEEMDQTDDREIMSQFQRLKQSYPIEWRNFIDLLIEQNWIEVNPNQRLLLLNQKTDLDEILNFRMVSRVSEEELKERIRGWAHWRLENVWKTLDSIQDSLYTAYLQLAEQMEPGKSSEEYERMAREKIQIIFIHSAYPLSFLLPPGQQEAIDRALEEWNGRVELSYAGDVDEGSAHRLEGDVPGTGDVVHGSKYGAWSHARRRLKHDFLFSLDAGHRIDQTDFSFLPNLLEEFNDPKLALMVPILTTYGTPYSKITEILDIGETTWNKIIHRAKEEDDTEGFFGKGIHRVSAMESARAILSEYNSEDTVSGHQYMLAGLTIKHLESLIVKQSAEKTFNESLAFVHRFGATVPDILKSIPFMELILSKRIPWNYKVGIIYNLMFYAYHVPIIWANVAFLIISIFLPFNIYVSLPLAGMFVIFGFIHSQAINRQTFQFFIEKHGLLGGIWKALTSFPLLFLYYTAVIPGHVIQWMRGWSRGIEAFTLSPRLSNLRRHSWSDIYNHSTLKFGIRLGAILAPLVLLSNFHPFGTLINIAISLMVFSWVFSPFMFNLHKKGLGAQLITGFLGGLGAILYTWFLPVIAPITFVWKRVQAKLEKRKKAREEAVPAAIEEEVVEEAVVDEGDVAVEEEGLDEPVIAEVETLEEAAEQFVEDQTTSGEEAAAATGDVTLESLEEIVAQVEESFSAEAGAPETDLEAELAELQREMGEVIEEADLRYGVQPSGSDVSKPKEEVVPKPSDVVSDTQVDKAVDDFLDLLGDDEDSQDAHFGFTQDLAATEAIESVAIGSLNIQPELLEVSAEKMDSSVDLIDAARVIDLVNQAFADLKETVLKEPQELKPYWRQLLKREDNLSPPGNGKLELHVAPFVKLTSLRRVTQDGVRIVLGKDFLQALLENQEEHPEAVKRILAERLFHELGHTNNVKSFDQKQDEEIRVIERDYQLYQELGKDQSSQSVYRSIERFFGLSLLLEEKPFASGYYFENFLKDLSKDPFKRYRQIRSFVRANLLPDESAIAERIIRKYPHLNKQVEWHRAVREAVEKLPKKREEETSSQKQFFAFDVDGTLLASSDRNLVIDSSPVFYDLLNLLRRGFHIAIITGNKYSVVKEGIVDKIPPLLRKNLLVYADGGATKHEYQTDEEGVEVLDYREGKVFTKESIERLNTLLLDVVKRQYPQSSRERFAASDFKDWMVEGSVLREVKINPRGVHDDSVAELSIVFLPSEQALKAGATNPWTGGEDTRTRVLKRIKSALKEARLDKEIEAVFGGRVSIDVKVKGVSKRTAYEDILAVMQKSDVPTSELIYFGDEFRQGGDDDPIALVLSAGLRVSLQEDVEAMEKYKETLPSAARDKLVLGGEGVEAVAKWLQIANLISSEIRIQGKEGSVVDVLSGLVVDGVSDVAGEYGFLASTEVAEEIPRSLWFSQKIAVQDKYISSALTEYSDQSQHYRIGYERALYFFYELSLKEKAEYLSYVSRHFSDVDSEYLLTKDVLIKSFHLDAAYELEELFESRSSVADFRQALQKDEARRAVLGGASSLNIIKNPILLLRNLYIHVYSKPEVDELVFRFLINAYLESDPRFRERFNFYKDQLFDRDKDLVLKALKAEFLETYRSPLEIILGRVVNPDEEIPGIPHFRLPMVRGPPIEPKYLYLGGGGAGITGLSRAFMMSQNVTEYPIRQHSNNLLFATIASIYDDGGSTGKMIDEFRDKQGLFLVPPGDITAIINWMMPAQDIEHFDQFHDAKLSAYFQERYYTQINVNHPQIGLEELQAILGDIPGAMIFNARKQGLFESLDEIEYLFKNKENEFFSRWHKTTYSRIKKQILLSGQPINLFEHLVRQKIVETHRKIELGEFPYPKDWLYVTSNMIEVAKYLDQTVVLTGLNRITGGSWPNFTLLASMLKGGQISLGEGDFATGKVAEDEDGKHANYLYDWLGAYGGYSHPVSHQEATLASVYEGNVVRVKDSGKTFLFAFGQNESGELLVRVVDRMDGAEFVPALDDPLKAEPLDNGNLISEIEPDVYIVSLNQRKKLRISYALEKGTLIGEKKIKVEILNPKNQSIEIFYLDDVPGEEGKTRVAIGKNKPASLATTNHWSQVWSSMDVQVSFTSRLAEEQTIITDVPSPMSVSKLILKIGKTTKENRYEYRKDPEQYTRPLEDPSGRRLKELVPLPEKYYPDSSQIAVKMIRETQRVISFGEGSIVTSLLPALIYPEVIQALRDRRKEGLPIVFFVKPTQDEETAGLNLKQQIDLLERSIQHALIQSKTAKGEEVLAEDRDFSLDQVVSHVLIPRTSDEILKRYQKIKHEKEEKLRDDSKLQGQIERGEKKLSKEMPKELLIQSEEDYAFLMEDERYQGKIQVVDFEALVVKNKIVFDKEVLSSFLDFLGRYHALLRLLPKEKQAEYGNLNRLLPPDLLRLVPGYHRNLFEEAIRMINWGKVRNINDFLDALQRKNPDLKKRIEEVLDVTSDRGWTDIIKRSMIPNVPQGEFVFPFYWLKDLLKEVDSQASQIGIEFLDKEGTKFKYLHFYFPAEMTADQEVLFAEVVATSIYNKLGTFGPVTVKVMSGGAANHVQVREKVLSYLNGPEKRIMQDFLLQYNPAFQMTSSDMPRTSARGQTGAFNRSEQDPVFEKIDVKQFQNESIFIGLSMESEGIRFMKQRVENGKLAGEAKEEYRWVQPPETIEEIAKTIVAQLNRLNQNSKDWGSPNLRAVGISWPSAISGDAPFSTALDLLDGVKLRLREEGNFANEHEVEKELQEQLKKLPQLIQEELKGVPVYFIKDGNALGVSQVQGHGSTQMLLVGMKKSVSTSFIGLTGAVEPILGELGNNVVDSSLHAAPHTFTKVRGSLQQYLSNQSIERFGRELLMGNFPQEDLEKIVKEVLELEEPEKKHPITLMLRLNKFVHSLKEEQPNGQRRRLSIFLETLEKQGLEMQKVSRNRAETTLLSEDLDFIRDLIRRIREEGLNDLVDIYAQIDQKLETSSEDINRYYEGVRSQLFDRFQKVSEEYNIRVFLFHKDAITLFENEGLDSNRLLEMLFPSEDNETYSLAFYKEFELTYKDVYRALTNNPQGPAQKVFRKIGVYLAYTVSDLSAHLLTDVERVKLFSGEELKQAPADLIKEGYESVRDRNILKLPKTLLIEQAKQDQGKGALYYGMYRYYGDLTGKKTPYRLKLSNPEQIVREFQEANTWNMRHLVDLILCFAVETNVSTRIKARNVINYLLGRTTLYSGSIEGLKPFALENKETLSLEQVLSLKEEGEALFVELYQSERDSLKRLLLRGFILSLRKEARGDKLRAQGDRIYNLIQKSSVSGNPFAPLKEFDLLADLSLTQQALEQAEKEWGQFLLNVSDERVIRVARSGEKETEAVLELMEQAFGLLKSKLKGTELEPLLKERMLFAKVGERAPPVSLWISGELNLNSIRSADGIVLNEMFLKSLLSAQDRGVSSEVLSWILAERLFHELGHTTEGHTYGEKIDEESKLIEQDYQLYKFLKEENVALAQEIEQFFQENSSNITFRSGYYFNSFLDQLSEDPQKRKIQISEYVAENLEELEFQWAELVENVIDQTETSPGATEKSAFVFDVDGTLLDSANKDLKLDSSPVFREIIELLTLGYPVAIITGNEYNQAFDRIVAPIPAELRKNLVVYANGAATKYVFAQEPNGSEDITYRKGKEITQLEMERLNEAIDKALKVYEVKRASEDFAKSFPAWMKEEGVLRKPEIQVRGAFGQTATQVAVVFVASRELGKENYPEEGDTRQQMMSDILSYLPEELVAELNIVAGGSVSIDINRKGIDKGTALKDFLVVLQEKEIEAKQVVYFGDEFYASDKKGREGNDSPVVEVPEVLALSVSADVEVFNTFVEKTTRSIQAKLHYAAPNVSGTYKGLRLAVLIYRELKRQNKEASLVEILTRIIEGDEGTAPEGAEIKPDPDQGPGGAIEPSVSILNKVLIASQKEGIDLNEELSFLALEGDSGNRQSLVELWVRDKDVQKTTMVVAALIHKGVIGEASRLNLDYSEEESTLVQSLEQPFLKQQQSDQEEKVAQLNLISRLFREAAESGGNSALILDSTMLRGLEDDPELIKILLAQEKQLALVVFEEDKNNDLYSQLEGKLALVYQSEVIGSLEEKAFEALQRRHKDANYDRPVVLTQIGNLDKWARLQSFNYYVHIDKFPGDSWFRWFSSPQIQPVLRKLGIKLEELPSLKAPETTQRDWEEIRYGNIILVSA